jgi:ribosomal protein S18 acetylase RimI-like enzyme
MNAAENVEMERSEGMELEIRDFRSEDAEALVNILKANQQYGHPGIDGPEAMRRVASCQAAEFLVAEKDGGVVGMIRGAYDGSRAIIYLVSVHPNDQRQGIGRALVLAVTRRFKERGAGIIAVIVPGDLGFWKKLHFRQTTRVMQAFPIDQVLDD